MRKFDAKNFKKLPNLVTLVFTYLPAWKIDLRKNVIQSLHFYSTQKSLLSFSPWFESRSGHTFAQRSNYERSSSEFWKEDIGRHWHSFLKDKNCCKIVQNIIPTNQLSIGLFAIAFQLKGYVLFYGMREAFYLFKLLNSKSRPYSYWSEVKTPPPSHS